MLRLSAPLAGARRLQLAALALVLVGSGLLATALPAAASTAPPSTLALSAPGNGEPPLIAYDAVTQNTYVAWDNANGTGVELCVIVSGTSGCEGGAPILLLDPSYPGISGSNSLGLGGLDVLPDGRVVVIGTPVSEGSVSWESEPGGSAFFTTGQGLQNGGGFISPVTLFYAFGNTVALNNTDVALLDNYGDYFSDSPFSSSSPSISSPNSNPSGHYPRKALETDGTEVGAMAAPAPAPSGDDIVVGVGDDYAGSSSYMPSGCINSEATGFGVSVGKVQGNSKSSGTLNHAGLPNYSVLACSALSPVLASGANGIGVLEEEGSAISGEGSDWTMDYRPFNATATGGSFGAPVELADITSQVIDGVGTIDVGEDNGTGVYATWRDLQGLVYDYSPDGGATWNGPVVVPAQSSGDYDSQVLTGVGGGVVEVAYTANTGVGTQVFLVSMSWAQIYALDNPPPNPAPTATATALSTSQASGTTTGANLSIPAGTVGEHDQANVSGANAAVATGTVSYGLYSSSSCSASSKVFSGGTSAVSSGVAAPSAPVTSALSPGKYYWQAAYSGDANNAASASACGSEVLTVTPAATIGSTGSSTTTSVTVTITCAAACTVTITIEVPGSGATSASKKGKKPKTIIFASGKFKLKAGKPTKLSVHLTKAGKQLLIKDHGHLNAKLIVAENTPGGLETTSRTIKITLAKSKHHK